MSQTHSFKPSPLIHFSNSHYNTHTVYTYTSKFCGNTCQSFMDIFMFLVVESCLTLCNPMDYSMPRFPVLHHLPEFAQTMPTESVMLSNHLILYHSLFLLPSIFPSIRVFSNESANNNNPFQWLLTGNLCSLQKTCFKETKESKIHAW